MEIDALQTNRKWGFKGKSGFWGSKGGGGKTYPPNNFLRILFFVDFEPDCSPECCLVLVSREVWAHFGQVVRPSVVVGMV